MTTIKKNIGVVDYGMGNLHSVAKALALQGDRVTVSDSRAALQNSDVLVLPGVGSFGAAMKNLARKNLDDFIRHWIDDGKSYVGICLGLQLLFERSEEDPGVPGLSALRGPVVKFRKKDFGKKRFTIPHMGWNTADRCHPESAAADEGSQRSRGRDSSASPQNDSFFRGIAPEDSFYFVHTYFPAPTDDGVVLTKTNYGKPFCSSVVTKNIFASQFHPEKSGKVGLKLLSNILERKVS